MIKYDEFLEEYYWYWLNNIRNIGRIVGNDRDGKVYKLLQFAGEERDIADPWYTGNFDATYDDVLKGCTALLNEILDAEKFTKEN